MTKNINEHEGKKYKKVINPVDGIGEPINVDIYCVMKAFGVTCPARFHAIKKLLCCGNRGKGSELDDLMGAEAAISRAIEMQKEQDELNKKDHSLIFDNHGFGYVPEQVIIEIFNDLSDY